jgi:hypothetical protein
MAAACASACSSGNPISLAVALVRHDVVIVYAALYLCFGGAIASGDGGCGGCGEQRESDLAGFLHGKGEQIISNLTAASRTIICGRSASLRAGLRQ